MSGTESVASGNKVDVLCNGIMVADIIAERVANIHADEVGDEVGENVTPEVAQPRRTRNRRAN